jgi:hypothetical protein
MNRRPVLASLLSLVGLLLSASAARAEVHVDFLFGGGHGHGHHGHHHHHHHGWYGGYRGFYWPRPVYYYPPPPVYVPVAQPVPLGVPTVSTYGMGPAVAQPAQTVAAPTPAPTLSTAQSNALPAYQGRGISIRNPVETNTAVTFVVDSRRENELSPGESHSLSEKSSYVIEFDRGGEFGTARHVVNEGSYEFVATDRGWDLRRLDVLPTGPNSTTVRRNTLPTR